MKTKIAVSIVIFTLVVLFANVAISYIEEVTTSFGESLSNPASIYENAEKNKNDY